MISIFLNLLRLTFWTRMWSILEDIPCALEKNVYSASFVWGSLFGPECDQFWRIFHVHLRRMCIPLLLYGMFYKYQFSPSDLIGHLMPVFLYLFSAGSSVHWLKSRMLKSPTIIVLLLISPFMVDSIYLKNWGTPILDAYIFTIAVSFGGVDPLIIM